MLKRLERIIHESDSGLGMIMVLGVSMVVMILVLTAGKMADNALTASQHHQRFETALDVSEAGIDQALGRLQKNNTYNGCSGCSMPNGGFASASAEQAWAKSTITTLASSTPSLVQTVNGGQYLAIRPVGGQTIYSMGWVPNQASPRDTRLIKVQYIFGPWRPGDALLTNGDLCFSGSVLVNDLDPSSPANAHTNSNVSSCSNGNGASSITITGTLTASGSYNVSGNANVATGSGGGQPQETLPDIDPYYIYQTQSANYTNNWYDLCPDGTVRSPDPSATTPCSGTTLGSATSSTAYRGWNYTAATSTAAAQWTMSLKNSPYSGVYYVYQGDANIGSNGGNSSVPWNATILAQATSSDCGDMKGGNITWKLFDISNYIPSLVMEAQANINDSANNNAGDGLFAAGNQVYMSTSSSTLTGAVVAGDQCSDNGNPSSVQGVTIHYDMNTEAPVQSQIRTVLWLEYVG